MITIVGWAFTLGGLTTVLIGVKVIIECARNRDDWPEAFIGLLILIAGMYFTHAGLSGIATVT